MKAENVRVAWGKEHLSGDLRIDVLVHDSTLNDMRFDISGSSLRLDDFKVVGESGTPTPFSIRYEMTTRLVTLSILVGGGDQESGGP